MIIAVINQKGGVGKTTSVVNLGAALAEAGRQVLLVDLDPQGSLSQFRRLNFPHLALEATTAKALPALLQRHSFDYALLDCPPALGPESAAALKEAHLALVPLQAEFAAWVGLANLIETVAVARERVNPTIELRIALTMWARSRHCQEVEAVTRAGQGERVLRTVIRRSVTYADAAAARESVLTYAPRSTAAVLYRQLAQEIEALCPAAGRT